MKSFLRDNRAFPSPAFSCGYAVLCLLLFILPAGANAQQFSFRHYGQDDGLKNLDVFQLLQDKSGYLWAATENGLFRYDGSGFSRFGAPDGLRESMVVAILEDPSGRIWITTNDHLYYFGDNRFHMVSGPGALKLGVGERMIAPDARHLLVLDHSTLLVAQPNGPILRDGPRWTLKPFFTPRQIAAHPELAQIHSIFHDADGTLWMGCGQTLCRFRETPQGSSIEVLGREQGLPPTAAWLAIFRDSHGTLWIRSPHYIRVLTPGSSRFVPRDIAPVSQSLFYGAGILTFDEDPAGDILTQSTTGLARWDWKHARWLVFDASNGIDFSYISTILTDRQGSLWFSTRGHGIERWLGYGEVENWTVAQGLRNEIVWTMFRDRNGHLLIGDQLEVSVLDEEAKRIGPMPGFPPLFQQADGIAQSSDGAIWVTSLPGFVLHAAPRDRRFVEVARLPEIVRMFTDSERRIWFCTREGLFVAHDPAASAAIERIPGALISADSFADAVEDASGNLWFVSDHHLYRFAHSNSDPSSNPSSEAGWSEIPLATSMTRGDIRSVAAAPDGTLWIGGGLSSLYHLRIDNNRVKVLAALAAPEIVSTDIEFVRFDRSGLLWVGTDLGVEVFDGTHWKLITQRDGLISNDTNEGAFYADADGSVWIGVNGGLIHLLHPRQIFRDEELQVRLTSAILGNLPLSLSGGRNRWRWRNLPLNLHFTSFNYDRQGSLEFRYRLMGLEPSWTTTTMNSLHYAAVPPGDYKFEVQALDPNRRDVSSVASLAFTIRPPWWRSRLFYLLCAVLFTTLSYLVWRWRERLLLREQAALKQLIAQRTSELETEKIELVAAREALLHQASHDALTGLWNRPAILEILEREMNRAHREGARLTVVLADLDHFKQINDTYGHLAGDVILRDAALRMVESIRPYDFIGRYGGEEFLIILPGLSADEPFSRLKQLHQAMSERPFLFEDTAFHVTSSFGATSIDADMLTVEDMVRCADEALYRAKDSGRDCIIFYAAPGQTDSLFETH